MARRGMNAILLVLSGILVLYVRTTRGNYEHTCSVDVRTPHPRGVCGASLFKTLRQLCNGRFAGGSANKRGAAMEPETGFRGLFLTKKNALSYLDRLFKPHRVERRQLGTQGITCECCFNHCTYYELRQYCRY